MKEGSSEKRGITLQIRMLGGFELSVGEKTISDQVSRTRQLWNLLEFLITYRDRTLSQEELIAALWPENDIENPASALKNLVYRIRSAFTSYGIPYAKEMIYYQNGAYHWNNSLPCTVDVEEFARLAKEAGDASLPSKEREKLYQQAVELYRGDFLPGSSYEEWVVPLASYYRNQYFFCVHGLMTIYDKEHRFAELQLLSERALLIDPLEELPHRGLIYALIKQEKSPAALEHYNYATNLFYRELGVRPSQVLRGLYREIIKSVNDIETDIGVIKTDLREQSITPGAYYCEYEVFRDIYRLEARAAARTGQTMFLALLTVTDYNDHVPEARIYNKVMDQLLQVIRRSLRRGDVVSRFSATQYVMMLPSVTYENGETVLHRVERNFKLVHRRDDVKLHKILQPLDPVEVPDGEAALPPQAEPEGAMF